MLRCLRCSVLDSVLIDDEEVQNATVIARGSMAFGREWKLVLTNPADKGCCTDSRDAWLASLVP